MPHAVALLSGGLDSRLAVLCLLRLGVKVTAMHFLTSFGCSLGIQNSLVAMANRYGFDLKVVDISKEFFEIVKKPSYGYGKNMNPCVDCKIMMLAKAGSLMRQIGADCVVTGEVLGQRPMSQQRHIFNLMEKRTGLKGYILRPLSALLLPPTEVEKKGLIDRQRLYGISGRSRKAQIALAEEFGLDDYPAPAGGCLLTEPNYAYRLRELLTYDPEPSQKDIELLKFGRHFRLNEKAKLIVGRDERENERLMALLEDHHLSLETESVEGPFSIITANTVDEKDLLKAASICARYSDGRHLEEVDVLVRGKDRLTKLRVSPSDGKSYEYLMIKKPTRQDV